MLLQVTLLLRVVYDDSINLGTTLNVFSLALLCIWQCFSAKVRWRPHVGSRTYMLVSIVSHLLRDCLDVRREHLHDHVSVLPVSRLLRRRHEQDPRHSALQLRSHLG